MFSSRISSLVLVLSTIVCAGAQAKSFSHQYVPPASERVKQAGYTPVEFPTQYVINEQTGQPDPALASLVSDPLLRIDLQNNVYIVLQVRELAVRPAFATKNSDGSITLPFAISLKHTRADHLVNQGTIDVAGAFEITVEGNHLTAKVSRFDDSSNLEGLGRFLIGAHSEVDLAFAAAVIPPVVEKYYNEDASRIQSLLSVLNPVSVKP